MLNILKFKFNFPKLFLSLQIIVCSIFILIFPKLAYADGFLVPQFEHRIQPVMEVPNFSVKNHFVNVEISDQYAKTKVEQIFKNDSSLMLEGTYIFPIPIDASISNFSMYMGNKKVKGQIYSKEEARKIYEDIVRKRKDPALLEFFNNGFFKASVFPIPPNGEIKTELVYEELIKVNNKVHKYVYSLNTEKFSNKPLEDVAVNIKIKTKQPLKSIYSPTYNLKISRINDYEANVSYEEKNTRPNSEFVLYYSVSEKDLGMNILTYNDDEENKGYFLLLSSPKYKTNENDIVPKNVIFVIDTSGSMGGEKIEQAKNALRFCVEKLNNKDYFNIVTFNDQIESYKKSLLKVNKGNVDKAIKFIDGIESTGSTDIEQALKTGLSFAKNSERSSTVLFLTDGMPTSGETDINKILINTKKFNSENSKIFVFGVGFDVNIQFLDKISLQNHGYSEYVRPEENIEKTVSDLFGKINIPVMTDISITYDDVNVSDVYPKELPDLFKGSQLMILGRYRDGYQATVTIRGKVSGKTKTMSYPVNFAKSENTPYLPKLWATRKIGYLLDEIRLKGNNNEITEEIVRLSKKYGIITEFTSFLIREDADLNLPAAVMREEAAKGMATAKSADTGSWAVSQSRNASNLKNQAVQSQNSFLDKEGRSVNVEQKVQNVINKTFYQKKEQWVDSEFKNEKVLKIKIFSTAYFELSHKIKGIDKYLSVGKQVQINIKGINVQIGEIGKEKLTESEKRSLGI